jgi:hypothetical protein
MRLAMLGDEFTVLERAELVDEVGVLADRLSRAQRASESHEVRRGKPGSRQQSGRGK